MSSWGDTPAQILEQAPAHDPEAWLIDMGDLTSYPDAQWVIEQVLEELEREHDYSGDNVVQRAVSIYHGGVWEFWWD